MAICDLTITYERRTAVDFTMPFMTLGNTIFLLNEMPLYHIFPSGISILFAKPSKEPPDLFSFLSPLSVKIWMYMGTAYLGVSLFLYILARFLFPMFKFTNLLNCRKMFRAAPDDWENPHPCEKDPEEVENAWTLLNCTWLAIGSIMGQGCDILPK